MESEIISELYQKYKMEIAEIKNSEKIKRVYGKYGLVTESFNVHNNEISALFKKPIGNYSITNFDKIMDTFDEKEFNYLVTHLSNVIKQFITLTENLKVLIAALGTRHLSADSLGESTIKNIIVTRHLKKQGHFKRLPEISVFSANVLGVTGIESFNVIKGVIDEIKVDKLIVIDTFCSSNYKRLGTSFQINDGGIVPGGGIDNPQPVINKKTTGVDVICIGVPLVVYAHSFVDNAINDLGYDEQNKDVADFVKLLQNYDYNNMIVTFHDIDEKVKLCGKVLAYSINKALTGFSLEEQKRILNGY